MTPFIFREKLADLKVLRQLVFGSGKGRTHAERLENFYAPQAAHYDCFRSRLLHGRELLMKEVQFPSCGVWVDFGAGTGENLRLAGNRVCALNEVHLVDLSPSLLEVARTSVENLGLRHIHLHHSDACKFELVEESVDVVTFSYSLTMIPDWYDAILNAERLLKPGGLIAITDFYVSRKYPEEGMVQHHALKRAFWRSWFATDNVFLNGDHLAMVLRHFDADSLLEKEGSVPFLPLLKAPFYVLLARKKTNDCQSIRQPAASDIPAA